MKKQTKKSRGQLALAATAVDTNAFTSIVVAILLKYNGNDVAKVIPELPKWYAQAKPFLDERPDVAKVFTSAYNVLSLNKTPKEPQVVALADVLRSKPFRAHLEKAIKVTPDQIKFLALLARHATSNDQDVVDTTWEKIRLKVSSLKHPILNKIFAGNEAKDPTAPKAKDIAAAASQCAAIVKQVAGRSSCYLTRKEAADLRKSNPTLSEKYSKLNKIIENVARANIKRIILASGQDKMSVAAIAKQLQSKGIQNNLPIGFTGGQFAVVGDKYVAYTAEGKELNAVPYGLVQMNPEYDAKEDTKFVLKQLNDYRVEYRTLDNLTGKRSGKFSTVHAFLKNEDAFRKSWLKDLMLFDPKKELGRPPADIVRAAMLEIMHATRQRAGGKANKTDGKQTFGLTTMHVDHINLKPTSVSYSYSGKKGATQSAELSLKGTPEAVKLGEILHALIDKRVDKKGRVIPAKKAGDFLFTHRTATLDKPISAESLNKYMKGVHGIPMSSHKFRHAAATKMAMAILEKGKAKFKPGKATQKQVDDWVKAQFKEIGKKLHHSNAKGETMHETALKSYIDPEVMHNFYSGLGLRTIKGVPTSADAKSSDEGDED